jgi:hypothetical protein
MNSALFLISSHIQVTFILLSHNWLDERFRLPADLNMAIPGSPMKKIAAITTLLVPALMPWHRAPAPTGLDRLMLRILP